MTLRGVHTQHRGQHKSHTQSIHADMHGCDAQLVQSQKGGYTAWAGALRPLSTPELNHLAGT